ncbi:hypothetical protein DEU56DRAFT_571469 [Suillus clintonianus]|uniref:uncharacterized protein n=1 Tax=Suillus clintonianus TaxID=1904413 RepID=UPI001B85EE2E|nr:uncharacterized protein DEU56DRAFT_571469 [Suillus clintonianus]KAG2125451.1 hypothetical protein DEU56DRAFT_571469 [Suillus clintonianus]
MSIPAVNRMFLIAAWLESIVYVNCVLFVVCMYALFSGHKKVHWINASSCIYHISVATAHNIICLIVALQAFTNPAVISVPDGSSLYLLQYTGLTRAMTGLVILNAFGLNILLIWRLLVVYNYNRILGFVMVTLETGQFTLSIVEWVLIPIELGHISNTILALGKASCALDLALTISVTSGISYRLWRASRNVNGLTSSNAYKAAIYTIIESGAIYTASVVVVCALFQIDSNAGIIGVGVAVQISTLTPLFLIASISFGLMQRNTRSEAVITMGPTFARPIQVTITEEIRTHPIDTVDSSSRSTGKSQSIRSYHDNV